MQAKDDNLILLISGFIQQIQRNHRVWYDEAALSDLFGLKGLNAKLENAATMSLKEVLQVHDKNTGCLSIINNLLNIFAIQPQYFRLFTLYNCFNVVNYFYMQDQRMALKQSEVESFQKVVQYA